MDATNLDDDRQAPISRLLAEVATRCPNDRISLGELAEAFGDRGFGLLLLLLCLPALLPAAAAVFGIPILILGVQMGLGYRRPKLTAFIARQSLKRSDILRLTETSSRWLAKVEGYVRPRPGPLLGRAGESAAGWLTAYSALMIILPGPGTNGPPAFGVIVMALGLIEHDNRTLAIGIAVAILGNIFATAVLASLAYMAVFALYALF